MMFNRLPKRENYIFCRVIIDNSFLNICFTEKPNQFGDLQQNKQHFDFFEPNESEMTNDTQIVYF